MQSRVDNGVVEVEYEDGTKSTYPAQRIPGSTSSRIITAMDMPLAGISLSRQVHLKTGLIAGV